MTTPSRATPAGRAYLDLRAKARGDRRPVEELLQLYVLESFLARLAESRFADRLVLKGGVLLAAFGERRPTRDIDLRAQALDNDTENIRAVRVFVSDHRCGRAVHVDHHAVLEAPGGNVADHRLPWRQVPASQAERIEGYLLELASQCRSHYLDYQAEEALQQLAWLVVGGRRLSRYVDAAARLGSDHWLPIEAMAESALRSGRQELAVEVFRAADRPGFHQQHLRQRCLVLTGVDIADSQEVRPKLRVVQSRGDHP